MLEHDELDSLLNKFGWDQPLSPLDLNSLKDPNIISFLSSPSSLFSAAVLKDQPPNSLVDNLFQPLTDNPIRLTDNPTVPQHESRANFVLPSLFDSSARSNNTQSAESQSTPPSPRQRPSNSTALIAPTQDARVSLSRNKQNERHSHRQKAVRRARFNPYLHYKLTNAFSSWEIVFWDSRRQDYTIRNTALSTQRLVVPLTAVEIQPVQ